MATESCVSNSDAARLVKLLVRTFGRLEIEIVEDYEPCGTFHYPRRGDDERKHLPPSQKCLPRRQPPP